jgi:hypothetical protein
MAQRIGYQDGIAGFVSWVRKTSLGLVKYRPVGDRPASLEQWYWLEKYERTLRILKDDHDSAITSPEPPDPPDFPDPPDPPVGFVKVAPKACNEQLGSDQRFCMHEPNGNLRPGVSRLPNGQFTDESGAKYASDGDGLEESAVRNKDHIPGLVGARELDGRPVCSLPLVGDPSNNTGSWKV